ncbi:MAG: toprim domain-containing protein [Patescibacteria group bacterium]
MIPDPINKLTELFSNWPGIGPRQAKRFVIHLLRKPQTEISELTTLISELKKQSEQCLACRRWFIKNESENKTCSICLDNNRNQKILMIVEKDQDIDNILQADIYNGLFFVLGGLLPVANQRKNNFVTNRLQELKLKLNQNPVTEIIIALSLNPDSEHTARAIKDIIANLPSNKKPTLSFPGRGLSTGLELEYSDPETLRYAISRREPDKN